MIDGLRGVSRGCLLAVLLILAACASTGGFTGKPMRAPAPPSDYVHVGSGDLSGGKKIKIQINSELMDAKDPDIDLSVFFGFHFMGAMADAKPAKLATSGNGANVNDPILLTAATGKTELDDIGNYLADRYPDRDKLVGSLFRSPEKRYVLWLRFLTAQGPQALYFDATKWADAHRKAYGG